MKTKIATLIMMIATTAIAQVGSVKYDTATNALTIPTAANFRTANAIQQTNAALTAITANTGTLTLSGVTLTLPEASQFGSGKRAIIGSESGGTVTVTYPTGGNFLQLGRLRVTGIMETTGNFWAGGIETPYLAVGTDPVSANSTLFMHNGGALSSSQIITVPEFGGLGVDLDGMDEMTLNEAPQTLKGKTINAADNVIDGLVPQHINMSGATSRLVGVGQNAAPLTDPGAREITLGTGLAMIGNSLNVSNVSMTSVAGVLAVPNGGTGVATTQEFSQTLFDDDTQFQISDEFMGGLTTTGNIGSLGWILTNIAGTNVLGHSSELDRPSTLGVTTGATSGNGVNLNLGPSGSGSIADIFARPLKMKYAFKLNQTNALTIKAGIGNPIAAAPLRWYGIRYNSATDTNFMAVGYNNDGTEDQAIILAPVDTNWHTFTIERTSATTVSVAIDNLTPVTLVNELPIGASGVPFLHFVTTAAGSKSLVWDFFKMRMTLTR